MIEKQNIEWKENWSKEYFAWISAFANTEGGSLYIGLNDSGEVIGIADYEKLLEVLPNQIRDLLGMVCEVNHKTKDGLNYIEIIVPISHTPISYRGKFYKRSGSTTQVLNGSALQDFLLSKSNLSWDQMLVEGVTFDDMDLEAIEAFKESAVRTGRVPSINSSTDPELVLKKLNLINSNGVYTRASVVLFGKEPTKYFTTAFLKIGNFGKSPTELEFQDEIRGNAFQLAEKALTVLDAKYIIRNISYNDLLRIEKPEYPFDALREVLFNAIVHKAYDITPILIRVYDDKITIWNTGKLPDQLTPEDLKKEHGSYPRNKLMADTFYKGGHIESWGRGTIKIIEECEKHGLPEPLIEEKSGGVSVTIFKEIYPEKYLSELELNERQIEAVGYIKRNKSITRSEYESLFNIGKSTSQRDIDVLLEKNIIQVVGSGKSTKYIIDTKGHVI